MENLQMTSGLTARTRAFLPCLALAIGVTLVSGATPHPRLTSFINFPCPTSNAASDTVIADFKKNLVIANAEGDAFRSDVGLAATDSSLVTAVTDSLVCTRVTLVIDSATRDTSTASYFVVHAGRRYIAFPHLQDRMSLFFLDTSFVFLGVIPR